ncbi:DNA repair protein RecO [Motilimonas sp. 1_MG-2023]|uniref:DNA repair protein RecO n=1 Tax=Motilimonas TaxID=1914248 RepID=UPI0026E30211|nr:DNA repair protein RecO [Motilimonas sp. 1_MG-2023]MDO6527663.1 DNA repair protein RecO [Motilimonas sp. 1_MG-2023]
MQDAFVLHIRPYRESSQLVEIYSRQEGRVSILVRGSRSKRSNLKGILQPFTLLNIAWGGKGQLKFLRSVEAQTHALPLPGDKLYLGLYLNELLYRLLEHLTPYPELFQCYQDTLLALAKGQAYEPILRVFELELLTALGYAIDFEFDAQSQQPIAQECFYRLVAEQGFVLTEQGDKDAFWGGHIQALAQRDFSTPAQAQTAKRFCRLLINERLGNKPLISRQLFIQQKRKV